MKWTKERLSTLPTSEGYRLRGEAMTRIEVFSDAVFAFAVTMLVISLGSIPENYEQLIVAIKGVPSFLASFAIIMSLWISHRRWSRRFGLDDGISTFLTLALIFVLLVYVYPLRLMMNILFFSVSGGWFPSNFELNSTTEAAGLLVFFSSGFCLVALIQLGLYMRVGSQAKALCLSSIERHLVSEEKVIWSILAITSFASALIGAVFFQTWGYLAGLVFCIIPLVVPFIKLGFKRKMRHLEASNDSSGTD
jgi:uncharacterized membrane protein